MTQKYSHRFIILFLLTLFLNGLFWIYLVPFWHTPDEQSHFSQVAFLTEKGRNSLSSELDVTEEIYTSEQLLGTARDKNGNNKFTFHPEYRIEYTNSLTGKYEASIAALANTSAKYIFVYKEATRYPVLYYIPATWLYRFFYSSDIFTRVYIIRFWSLMLFMLNIWVVYKIGRMVFPMDKLMAFLLAILVGFQPMMVFANVGVTSDAFANLVFSLFLYFSLQIIFNGINRYNFIYLIIVSWLAISSKPQFIIVLPFSFFLILLSFFKNKRSQKNYQMGVATLLIGIIVGIYLLYTKFYPLDVIHDFLLEFNFPSYVKYFFEYTLPHTYREVLPWYWGVFDWLGVTYPRLVHRIINIIIFITGIGFIFWLRKLKDKKRNIKQNRMLLGIIYLLAVSLVYFLALSTYDWMSWYKSGYQLGIQGRYFFPTIIIHMIILLTGWTYIIPKKMQVKLFSVKLLGLLMIVLNFYGLYTIIKTYYDVSSLSTLLLQMSQYKPSPVKGSVLVILAVLYLLSLGIFLFNLLTDKLKQTDN